VAKVLRVRVLRHTRQKPHLICPSSLIHRKKNQHTDKCVLVSTSHSTISAITMPFLPSSSALSSAQTPDSTSGSEPNSDSSISEQSHTGDSSSTATGAGVNTGAGTTREKTEAEIEADRMYEEAMEEEYAKREGGA
jgi:hypothetical protein